MSEHRPSDDPGDVDSGSVGDEGEHPLEGGQGDAVDDAQESADPADDGTTASVRSRTEAAEPTAMSERKETTAVDPHTPERLAEYLRCWTLPGGTLAPDQIRALLAWSDTPDEERPGLEATLETTEQQTATRSLAPNQRRGHVSWFDRLKGLVRR